MLILSLLLRNHFQQAELTPLEANVILYTEHQIRNSHAPRTRYSGFPNAEFVRIAHLFVKMYVLISHTLDACGLRDMTVSVNLIFEILMNRLNVTFPSICAFFFISPPRI